MRADVSAFLKLIDADMRQHDEIYKTQKTP
jgi:hypothetical protein